MAVTDHEDPQLIVQFPHLTSEEKLRKLLELKRDAQELLVAEDENMGVGNSSEEAEEVREQTVGSRLQAILKAIRQIDPSYTPDTETPTKHGDS